MRRQTTALFLAVGIALAAPAARAQIIQPMPVLDTISMNLTAEDWVRSETARVTLVVDAAGNGADAATLRPELLKVAASMADKADWRIVRLDRRPDEAGLDRWQAELEARLPEAQLANLGERAKKASRPGLQVRVGGVAFDPTLAEVEAAKGKLREDVYRRANEELARLKAAFPDREFRIGTVDFFEPEMFPAQPMPHRAAMSAMEGGMAKADVVQPGVQDKLKITARVMLSAFATQPQPQAPQAPAPR